jgi:hypothetical protein
MIQQLVASKNGNDAKAAIDHQDIGSIGPEHLPQQRLQIFKVLLPLEGFRNKEAAQAKGKMANSGPENQLLNECLVHRLVISCKSTLYY